MPFSMIVTCGQLFKIAHKGVRRFFLIRYVFLWKFLPNLVISCHFFNIFKINLSDKCLSLIMLSYSYYLKFCYHLCSVYLSVQSCLIIIHLLYSHILGLAHLQCVDSNTLPLLWDVSLWSLLGKKNHLRYFPNIEWQERLRSIEGCYRCTSYAR